MSRFGWTPTSLCEGVHAAPQSGLIAGGSRIYAASITGVDWTHFAAVKGDSGGYAPRCSLRFGNQRRPDNLRPAKVFRRRGGYRPPERA